MVKLLELLKGVVRDTVDRTEKKLVQTWEELQADMEEVRNRLRKWLCVIVWAVIVWVVIGCDCMCVIVCRDLRCWRVTWG